MIGQPPEPSEARHPLPIFVATVRAHAPQGDAAPFHGKSSLKGRLPHSHLILEDMPFDDKQRLGKHIELFHDPNQ